MLLRLLKQDQSFSGVCRAADPKRFVFHLPDDGDGTKRRVFRGLKNFVSRKTVILSHSLRNEAEDFSHSVHRCSECHSKPPTQSAPLHVLGEVVSTRDSG